MMKHNKRHLEQGSGRDRLWRIGGKYGVIALLSVLSASSSLQASRVYLSDLDLSQARSAVDKPQKDRDMLGGRIDIASEEFNKGVTLHPPHDVRIMLDGKSTRFRAKVGMDNDSKKLIKDKKPSYIRFVVVGDGKVLFDEKKMYGEKSSGIDVDVTGMKELHLITEEPQKVKSDIKYQAAWADAHLEGASPRVVDLDLTIYTPKASLAPRINAAKIFGLRPNAPLLFTLATSGERPMRFSVEGLPEGVVLDAEKGRLSGRVSQRGEYPLKVTAQNKHGRYTETIVLKVGSEIALTPPMGWNSWYCWSESVSDQKIRDIAKGFVDKGLVNYGWTYINIDDCWGGPERGGQHHALMGNERFQDMKGMCDYVHAQGLKVGIYSTLWMSSFAGFIGGTAPNAQGDYSAFSIPEGKRRQRGQVFGRHPMSNQTKMASIGPYWFVDNDVRQFAEWGIDYVKYDWSERVDQDELMSYVRDHQAMPANAKTHYGVDPKQGKYEYWTRRFRDSFRATDRDIILSLSPRSDFASAKVNSTYSNLWRTTEDIYDSWASISESFHNDHWRPYQRQGHWNDPDMLQIGNKGVPNQFVRTLEPSRLTPNEQYTQMTLWSMIAAPLLMSCDIASMDDFTLGLLTNPEVLEINQDALGIQGKPAVIDGDIQVWTRELADGSKAVAIFNLGYGTDLANVNFEQLGLAKEQRVRDVWSHKDLGVKSNGFEESLKGHQSRLFKVSRP